MELMDENVVTQTENNRRNRPTELAAGKAPTLSATALVGIWSLELNDLFVKVDVTGFDGAYEIVPASLGEQPYSIISKTQTM